MYRSLALAAVLTSIAAAVFFALRGGRGDPDRRGGPGFSGARAEQVEGMTVIRLAGPPRVKGRALGAALAPRIRAELELHLPADEGLREFVLATCGERLAGFVPDAYREEISGIAEGAGITFPEALFLNTRFELAAFGLAGGEGEFAGEGAVGPGPTAGRLFDGDAARDHVVVVHEDADPPLALVARPGMAGGFLGVAGGTAAVLRPMRGDGTPTLDGLVWTLLLRRLLEEPPQGRYEPPAEVTGPVSVAMVLPDGAAGTLNLAVWGATWYASPDASSLTTDEPVAGREGEMLLGRREPEEGRRLSAEAARLLGEPPPQGRSLVALSGGSGITLALADGGSRRTARLRGPG